MNGSANHTPRKRKCSEYHDPDYAVYSQCKNAKIEHQQTGTQENTKLSIEQQRLQRVREIVEREFSYEITAQQQQLEGLETNIENAIKLFDKLRYKLVSDYYTKHEIPTSDAEAAQLRGEHTLFQSEPEGAQLPRHTSLKNLMSNNAKTLADLLRINPQRAAAKHALTKIDEVTKASNKSQQKREQRRIQKLIREQGIVIDHSKTTETETSKLFDQEFSQLLGQNVSKEIEEKPASSGTALNSARLNNKVKHLIIVGNTSKYIEDESTTSHDAASTNQRLTHKWLIYVQAKDPTITPLEKLLKKIRFYLHPSYKPHDIVDIKSPPYQLSRRGWGEFPVRLQLFFAEELQQKPVQLLHNLVLDKTLTGLQTMGAETLVEIWLRPLQQQTSNLAAEQQNNELNDNNSETFVETNNILDDLNNSQRMRTLSLGQFKYDDLHNDDLFEFLNCIEDTPNMLAVDDIEKIQPTVVVNDPNLTSPSKLFNIKTTTTSTTTTRSSAVKNLTNELISIATPPTTTTMPTKSAVRNLFNEINASTTSEVPNNIFNETNTVIPNNIELTGNDRTTTLIETQTSIQNEIITKTKTTTPRLTTLKCYPQTSKPAVLCLKPQAQAQAPSSVTTTTTTPSAIVKSQTTIATTTMLRGQANKIIPAKSYEKKLVQLVDAQGKVRLVQMLVATTTTNQANKNDAKNILINNRQKPTTITTTTTTTTATSAVGLKMNSPFVFQKEGKIFICDPLQNKLKQQQKQQISLLKPQISLLKPNYQKQPAMPYAGKSSSIHMSVRETREMKQENSQSEREKIEQLFENSEFVSISSAIEFLLRRLPLIVPTLKTHLQAYNFIYCKDLTEFKLLTPMKQRALEWLRARYISQLVRSHKQLKTLIAATREKEKLYWTTKEIVLFARNYAYTPPLSQLNAQLTVGDNEESAMKKKIKTEAELLYYNTLTSMEPIKDKLNELERELPTEQPELQIDVLNVEDCVKKSQPTDYHTKDYMELKNCLLLPVPGHLESASELVENVCRALHLRLAPAEEVVANVRQPLAKIVLAQCVHNFVEKLLRRALSMQSHKQSDAISIQVLAKVIANPTFSDDYDFYNDNYLGVPRAQEESDKEDT